MKLEENQEIATIEGLYPKKIRNNKVKNELNETKECEEKINKNTLYVGEININMIFNNMKL